MVLVFFFIALDWLDWFYCFKMDSNWFAVVNSQWKWFVFRIVISFCSFIFSTGWLRRKKKKPGWRINFIRKRKYIYMCVFVWVYVRFYWFWCNWKLKLEKNYALLILVIKINFIVILLERLWFFILISFNFIYVNECQ